MFTLQSEHGDAGLPWERRRSEIENLKGIKIDLDG